MEYKKYSQKIIVRLDRGDEIVSSLKTLAAKEKITFACVSGIGAVGSVKAGYFDTKEKCFKSFDLTGDLEAVSFAGNINIMDGETYTHFHISVADESGKVYGGHLSSAVISGTGEFVVDCVAADVGRVFDGETGLNIFKF